MQYDNNCHIVNFVFTPSGQFRIYNMTLELFWDAFLRNSIFMITNTCTCYCKKVKRCEKLNSNEIHSQLWGRKICSSWMKKVSRYGNSLGGFFSFKLLTMYISIFKWRPRRLVTAGAERKRCLLHNAWLLVSNLDPHCVSIRCEIVWTRR